MNVVCVVRGLRVESGAVLVVVVVVVVVEFGKGWMPRDCAAAVCVRKAKGALESPLLVLGCNNARSRASCASLRFFSARRAALSFWVSTSLRRRV